MPERNDDYWSCDHFDILCAMVNCQNFVLDPNTYLKDFWVCYLIIRKEKLRTNISLVNIKLHVKTPKNLRIKLPTYSIGHTQNYRCELTLKDQRLTSIFLSKMLLTILEKNVVELLITQLGILLILGHVLAPKS